MRARPNHMTRRGATAAAATLLALGLAGCGEEESAVVAEDEPTATTVTLDSLDGRLFAGDAVDAPDHRLVRGTEVQLGFDGEELSAYAGCNHLFGTAAVKGERLHATALGGTEMGCPQQLADQDAWLQAFLAAGPAVALADGTLTLTAGGTTIELTEQPAPDGADGGSGDDPVSDGDVTGTVLE